MSPDIWFYDYLSETLRDRNNLRNDTFAKFVQLRKRNPHEQRERPKVALRV
ncbi:hypothetical protein [Nostoc sp.]